MKKWENFSDEQIRNFVKESTSINELAIKLGYTWNSGSGAATVKKMLEQKQIDTSHFVTQCWNKDVIDISKFKKGVTPSKRALNNLIILRGRRCEKCGQTTWLSQPIPLQVHHVDGDRFNNELNNLQLLCLNCHALTDNFGIKNYKINKEKISDETFVEVLKQSKSIHDALNKLKLNTSGKTYQRAYDLKEKYHIDFIQPLKKTQNNFCKDCGAPISAAAVRCIKCEHKKQQKVERPEREELKKLIRENSFTALSSIFGVSDNAIRKWCITYNLPSKKRDIIKYTDEEWEKI